ncbi:MAG: hypothetical protein N2203_08085, partial [Bacteroidia bacterium]|nr:hypothetical protein [Bacteroidia bacterium]
LLYENLSHLTHSVDSQILFKIHAAAYYKQSNLNSNAIHVLKSINTNNLSDSLKFIIKYQTALNYYLLNELTQSQNELIILYNIIHDTLLHYKAYPLNTIILNELYNWNEAKKLLLKYNCVYFKDTQQKFIHQKNIDSLYNTKNIPKLKNVRKAITLSTFIPGLGQMYSKNYSEGIIAFFTNTSIALLTITGIYYQYYFTSIIAGSSLLAKFYTGNISRAEYSAMKHNYFVSKKFNDNVKNYIINTYLK